MREPYVPTTADMRHGYIVTSMRYTPETDEHLLAKRRREVADEFDRWLAQERDKVLDPVRRILDRLADATEPPCDYGTWIEAQRQAINDISVHVYPEPSEG